MSKEGIREGSLEAPTRHPLDWKEPGFFDEESLYAELERVYDICHGCRRCVSLCNAFPTLFDLVDESDTMEVDGVDKKDYMKVVDHCYLCDLCYLTKCPYVPPHEWNIDFPHLMLRAKAYKFKTEGVRRRDRILSATDKVGTLAGIPVVVNIVNASNRSKTMRKVLKSTLGVHPDAKLPEYHFSTARKQHRGEKPKACEIKAAGPTAGKVVIYTTCFGNYNEPELVDDLKVVFEHNDIPVTVMAKEDCCGMPKLELGDLESVEKLKNRNIPRLVKMLDEGWDIVAPVPSCVLMYKQELPLMFPDDQDVIRVSQAIFDPFEYLAHRHKAGLMNTGFVNSLGTISYHVACHQRVQRIGMKTRDILGLVPDTDVKVIERCSGHDGTYAVKNEFHQYAVKIGRPVANRVKQDEPAHYTSDCPMAGRHIENILSNDSTTEHPVSLLRKAYGL